MADPAWSNVWGLWHCDSANGTLTTPNSVSGGSALTRASGTGTVSTAASKFGSASLTNAEWVSLSDTITVGASGQLTVEGWFYVTTVTPSFGPFQFRVPASIQSNLLGFGLSWITGGNSFGGAHSVEISDSTGQFHLAGTCNFVANAWNHIRWVIDLSGASDAIHQIYLNGTRVGTSNDTSIAGDSTFYASPYGGAGEYADEIRGCYEALGNGTTITVPTSAFPELHEGAGSSSGVASASAVGSGIGTLAGAVAAVGAASAIGSSTARAAGASSTVAAATAAGLRTASSPGAAVPAAMAAAVGSSHALSLGSTAPAAAASAQGLSTAGSAGSVAGAGQASGSGLSTSISSGLVSGVGQALAVGIPPMIGVAGGLGAALAIGQSTAVSVGIAAGLGLAFARWRLDAVLPRTLYAVRIGTPIGPNNAARKMLRTLNAARVGYPVAFHIEP